MLKQEQNLEVGWYCKQECRNANPISFLASNEQVLARAWSTWSTRHKEFVLTQSFARFHSLGCASHGAWCFVSGLPLSFLPKTVSLWNHSALYTCRPSFGTPPELRQVQRPLFHRRRHSGYVTGTRPKAEACRSVDVPGRPPE